jgi:hypothetical protein
MTLTMAYDAAKTGEKMCDFGVVKYHISTWQDSRCSLLIGRHIDIYNHLQPFMAPETLACIMTNGYIDDFTHDMTNKCTCIPISRECSCDKCMHITADFICDVFTIINIDYIDMLANYFTLKHETIIISPYINIMYIAQNDWESVTCNVEYDIAGGGDGPSLDKFITLISQYFTSTHQFIIDQ